MLEEKETSCMSNGKDMIIHLIAGLMKMTLNEILLNAIPFYKNESIFSKTIRSIGRRHLSNYSTNFGTKTDFKNATGIDTSKLV